MLRRIVCYSLSSHFFSGIIIAGIIHCKALKFSQKLEYFTIYIQGLYFRLGCDSHFRDHRDAMAYKLLDRIDPAQNRNQC